MAKVAWKQIKGHGPYAYLQKAVKLPSGKVKNVHLAYLGPAGKNGLIPGANFNAPPSDEFEGGVVFIPPPSDSVVANLMPSAKARLEKLHQPEVVAKLPIPQLGRLEEVPVREIWPDEARDFTPWLAKNLDRLGDELGMNLELVEQEATAGRFRLDVLARDVDCGVLVAIENQFGPTDHNHLGQLLTYAASRDVRRLIWVALDFLPEHRDALDWLNQCTYDGVEAYGVKVSAWRINVSLAPVFHTVVSPGRA